MGTRGMRAIALWCATLAGAPAAAIVVGPAQGVRLFQQHQVTAAGTFAHTDTGAVEVDAVRLRDAIGLAAGYLNVATASGWVVRNLPIQAEDVLPYAKVSSRFALGVATGTPVTSLAAAIDFAAEPATAFSGALLAQEVSVVTEALSGGGEAGGAPPPPPDLTAISFGTPQAGHDVAVQLDHPNIQAAWNQCVPMSVANSLQYLSNTAGLALPHAHKPGLRPDVSAGDDSLVGQIEQQMGRVVTSRASGQYTGFLDGLKGKLKYLARNGLAERVQVTHWGDVAAGNVTASAGGASMTSTGKGATVDFDAVMAAMREGQNCELDFTWPAGGGLAAGGHAVDLVAVGKTHGQHWIMHSSDVDQSSDSEGGGPAGSRFEYLGAPDASGRVFMSGTTQRVRLVICEKVLPPPVTVTVVELIDPAGHSCCVTPPPATMTVTRNGAALTLSGAASWLPLAGTVAADGRFDLQGSATVAGFPNVATRFTGTVANGVYDGTIAVGTNGALPTARPISWKVKLAEAVPPTRPAMRVNGYRQDVAIKARDAVKVSISMQAAALAGQPVDWWLVAGTADGQWLHFDLATMSWQPGLAATYTGPLVDIRYWGLPTLGGLPAGSYTFYFGIDTAPNGALDLGSAIYERTVLTVQP